MEIKEAETIGTCQVDSRTIGEGSVIKDSKVTDTPQTSHTMYVQCEVFLDTMNNTAMLQYIIINI